MLRYAYAELEESRGAIPVMDFGDFIFYILNSWFLRFYYFLSQAPN